MKNFYLCTFSLLLLSIALISCDSNDDEFVVNPINTKHLYILNQGSWGQGDALLTVYNPSSREMADSIFRKKNEGKTIGDLGQDIIVYGSKMYIAATESNKILITDIDAKLLKYNNGKDAIIEPMIDSKKGSPRSFASHNGYVYATMQSGYVAKIDTMTMLISKTVKIGSFPEEIVVGNDENLYVVNSGFGYGTTLSVINPSTFTETKTITTILNPTRIRKDKYGNIYVISMGDYGKTVKPTLQLVNTIKGEINIIGNYNEMAVANEKLFLMYYNYTDNATFAQYDIKAKTIEEKTFFTKPDGLDVNKISSISVDPQTQELYLGTSSFALVKGNDIYRFDDSGKFLHSFPTKGKGPIGVYFVNR